MDPYKLLGVSPSATDEEIKSAYRKLCREYHPDRQKDSVMQEIANQKMAEINAAYDKIMDMRRSGVSASGNLYVDIRSMIESGNYTSADTLLEQNRNDSSAEWNFLKGTVCLSRGWLNDAYTYFEKAHRLEPGNREYQAAFSQLNQKRNGQMNGNPYNNTTTNGGGSCCSPLCCCNPGGCDICDICECLICADCLCDCI